MGDILRSDAQTLTNTVNCVGVMGKGIALAFKRKFPDMFEDYSRRCSLGQVKLGEPYLFKRERPPWVLNFPTKDHWRSLARLEDIVRGMEYVLHHYKEWGITSIAVPPLGCGNGELDWRVVGPTLYRYLSKLHIPVDLYAPHGTPSDQLKLSFLGLELQTEELVPGGRIPVHVNPSWIVLVSTLDRIEREKYRWPVGRITFQKLAYFLTQAGLPTGLEFTRGSFGPWSRDLKQLMTRLQNNGLITEVRSGNAFTISIGPTFEDARLVYEGDLRKWKGVIERYADLFVRLNARQAEIAATVSHSSSWLARGATRPPSESQVLADVMEWKKGRLPVWDRGEVAEIIRDLNVMGFLKLEPSADLPIGRSVLLTA